MRPRWDQDSQIFLSVETILTDTMKLFSGLSRLKRLSTKMLEDSKRFSKLLVKKFDAKIFTVKVSSTLWKERYNFKRYDAMQFDGMYRDVWLSLIVT